LRFFADSIIQALRDDGYEVLYLKDCIPQDSPDPVLIYKSQALDAILLPLNGDFADVVTYPPSSYKGIIALQVKNHPEAIPQIMSRLTAFL
jgi:hypothetical protein